MQDIKSSKAAERDKLSGKFLKDGVDILAKQFLLFVTYPSHEESFQVLGKFRN